MSHKIAAQILFGQNEEPFLEAAMRSVEWVDYFTVCNTAPNSYWGKVNEEIVEDTAKDLKVELCYDSYDFGDNFSFASARNLCIAMTNPDDYILIVDADDVHYPELEYILKNAIEAGADSLTAYFYHLMVYKDIFQYVQPREIMYKNYPGTQWVADVHEQLVHKSTWPVTVDYHYVHYGYIKPQTQVFDRWKFYSDIVGDYHHYDGQDPHHILTDRISVSKPLPVQHPPVVQELLESYPTCPPGSLKENWETAPVEKVGLILLTYNDMETLPDCLETLAKTHTYPSFEVLAIDMGSTDGSAELLNSYREVIEMHLFETEELLSLTEALNFGFNTFRQRHDIQYIGWIHPDMRFDDPSWLTLLWKELQEHPKIGKICAANTRDSVPDSLIPGHEQCYIIRKDVVNKIGLFDENFIGIGGYEDWDYNNRIINHDNYKVMISPRATVYHKGMATRSRRDTTAEQIHNAQYYQKKYGHTLAPC